MKFDGNFSVNYFIKTMKLDGRIRAGYFSLFVRKVKGSLKVKLIGEI